MNKVKAFLQKKDVVISARRYFIDAMSAMTLGLFASLIVGTILKVIGEQLGLEIMVTIGKEAMAMMGPAVGVAVAYGLKAPPLVLFSSAITGAVGASLGGPVGAFLAAVIGAELGKMVSKETKVDIIVTPAVTIICGVLVGTFVGPYIDALMKGLGSLIMWATGEQPFIMGIIISVVMGLALTSPLSSAALGIMLDLSGLAAGAAAVGCTAQMVGFAAISFKENGWGGVLSQGIGTSMLQMPNIVRHPQIWIPPTVAGAILGPISTVWFKMLNIPAGSGMGSAGLVGQISTFEAMGYSVAVLGKVLLLHLLLPVVLSLLVAWFMRKKGWIKPEYLKLDI